MREWRLSEEGEKKKILSQIFENLVTLGINLRLNPILILKYKKQKK